MSCSVIEKLGEIEDWSTTDGRRHPKWVVLIIVIMGTMSGYCGYRALGDFSQRHREDLVYSLKIPFGRVPSYSTIGRVMMGIDFDELAKVFQSWAKGVCEHQSGSLVKHRWQKYQRNSQA